MNNTNWDGFRYFVAAAETGSLTAAAQQLGSNQPTVGRQIDLLESTLGVRLFQRSVKGLTLTEEGARILEQAQTIRAAVEDIQRNSQSEMEGMTGTVRLAMPEGLCLEVLAPLLPAFYRSHPSIRLILNVSPNLANLTRGEADIAVRLLRPREANIVARKLGRMELGLYAARHYLEVHGYPNRPQDLKQHRLISYGDQLAELAEDRWLAKHADPALNVLASDNTTTRLRATLAGVGVSIQPTLFGRQHAELVALLADTKLPHHDVWIAYHHDLRHLPRIRAVVDFIAGNLGLGTA